jgi:hypothetical protein
VEAIVKPIPAIVESVQDVEDCVRRAVAALREAEIQEERSGKRLEAAREMTAKRRLELGRWLIAARKQWPRSGPKAKGWGELLEREKISQQVAWNLMSLAGYVEVSQSDENDCETDIPTQRQVSAARKSETQPDLPVSNSNSATFDPDDVGEVPDPSKLDLRHGEWQTALAGKRCGVLICDPPYSARTHASGTTRNDGVDADGLTPTYDGWAVEDVHSFVAEWSPRTDGWMVALTDSELIAAWRDAYRSAGRYAFSPVPCVTIGGSVRISGDGPSSWAVYAMVARPATAEFVKWGTLPGAYVGEREAGAKSGRGKPRWLMDALVKDYSRPGDLICDPMAGYGSTLFAALRAGRRAIGTERDADAYNEAWRRARGARG